MATKQLEPDAIIERSLEEEGAAAFDDDSFVEGLRVFATDFNTGIVRGLYTEAGIAQADGDCRHYLRGRLRIEAYRRQRPEVAARAIDRPVFVMGMPRTGTTLLSNLLAMDPMRRSPLTWEIDEPVPPATTATLRTDPRAVRRLAAEREMIAANPEMSKYYRNSAIYPNECVFFLAHDFKTVMIESKGILPAYREYIYSCDVSSAYAYHRKFLQVLQADAHGVWNLKMPSHALFLETLFQEYPDARVIWTHRDPLTAIGSLCSLIGMSHMLFMGRIDQAWLGENYSWQAIQHVERIMDFRDRLGENRVIDVQYADLMRRPVEAMRQLYVALGDDFTPEAEAGMTDWLAANPQDRFGRHEYRLAEYGLTAEALAPRLDRYLARYDVAREG